jgi:hypothetical protein
MVGPGEPPPPPANQTMKEIAQDVEAKITQAACLAHEANKVAGKRHRGRQDDLGASKDEAEDGSASGGLHPK